MNKDKNKKKSKVNSNIIDRESRIALIPLAIGLSMVFLGFLEFNNSIGIKYIVSYSMGAFFLVYTELFLLSEPKIIDKIGFFLSMVLAIFFIVAGPAILEKMPELLSYLENKISSFTLIGLGVSIIIFTIKNTVKQ